MPNDSARAGARFRLGAPAARRGRGHGARNRDEHFCIGWAGVKMNTDSSFLHVRPWRFLLLSILCAVGTWTYVNRILIAHQVRDAAARGIPRGNLSDLYPRWLGARELLLRGRDPYSHEFTSEIQAGYYGRPLAPGEHLAPSGHEDRNYEQGFYYPVY